MSRPQPGKPLYAGKPTKKNGALFRTFCQLSVMDSATLAVEIFYDASAIIFTTCADFVSLDLKKEWGEILQNWEFTITSRTDTELFEIRAGVGTSVKKQAKNSPSPLSEQIIKNGRRRKILCYHAHLRV